ncbi:hypothetical protein EVAR_42390_1 [Eumeta japonica]|uniref:Uncharacterized protein n=1 Tax=Eumeta variegata TaxID=151549 RepID=A0A4C1YL43_EUMVA|nr:hypothetical protein EVAR_42390_1 [Eumeta japonica]
MDSSRSAESSKSRSEFRTREKDTPPPEPVLFLVEASACARARSARMLRLGVTYEKSVTLGNVTMSHRTRERPAECLASLSHSTMIGLPRALEN